MNASLILWGLHLALLPLYVFKSGGMQPSHLIFLAALGALALEGRVQTVALTDPNSSRYSLMRNTGHLFGMLFGVFVLYGWVVNSVWTVLLSSIKPMMFSVFQIYNLMLVYFVVSVAPGNWERFCQATRTGFAVALLLTVLVILFRGQADAAREEGLFNNPNQLAFFSLSACVVFFVMERLSVGSAMWNRIAIAAAAFACLASLSRAGLVGCGLVLLASLFSGRGGSSRMFMGLAIAGTMVLVIGSMQVIDRLETRNERLRVQQISTVEGRGYDRLVNHPEYAVLGAGEGEVRRFDGLLSSIGAEMHSTFGTVLFSYGVIGLLLYGSAWLLVVFAGPGLAFKVCAMTPLLYGVTHNGLRFSAAMVAMLMLLLGGLAMRQSHRSGYLQG
ncbi:hypothetical protein [Solimonas sp. SE-A11]|uniref:hypothetical protein n=1 Tax=Solimonas sp. SE-A11 TaxID=3054954 RepID=UPI00259CE895|nr:hypothetical protein [Solimonas sp. SE-A11]MDM4769731.1 hypothetical protein [Solimonas sp. SE-A11]